MGQCRTDADVAIGCYLMVITVHVTTPFLRSFLFGTKISLTLVCLFYESYS